MKRISTLICVLSLVCLYSVAKHISHISVIDGLANNYVKDITQDGQGAIWIATEAGLSKIEGCEMNNFRNSNSDLPSDALNSLYYETVNNEILIVGKFPGMVAYDCALGKFHSVSCEALEEYNSLDCLAPAAEGQDIWVMPYWGNIFRYNPQNREFDELTLPHQMEGVTKWCMLDNGDGTLWIGTNRRGLLRIDAKTGVLREDYINREGSAKFPCISIYALYKDSASRLWIGTAEGLALYNDDTDDFTWFVHDPNQPGSLISNSIYDIVEIDGSLWVASDIGGISILNLRNALFRGLHNAQFQNLRADGSASSLSSKNIRTIFPDTYGNIWIGNYSSGIDFVSHRDAQFSVLPYINHGELQNSYYSTWGGAADEEGYVWIGGENEVAKFRDNQLVRTYSLQDVVSHPFSQVFAIADAGSHLLLGMYNGGLLKFDKSTGRTIRLPLEQDNENVIAFSRDGDNAFWICSQYGLYRLQDSRIEKMTKINDSLSDISLYGCARDKDGNLWVATYGHGISIFDREYNLVKELNLSNGFASNGINSIFLDSSDRMWIASRNGLILVEDTANPMKYCFANTGYPDGDVFIRAIIEDANHNIWFTTNNTVCLVTNVETLDFVSFDSNQGVSQGNFIEGAACLAPDGSLYFGSLGGTCWVNPMDLDKEPVTPEVRILGYQLANQEEGIPIGAEVTPLRLSYDANSLSVSFSVLDYALSHDVEYAYRLQGIDQEWISTGNHHNVMLRNLRSGNYVLRVRARLGLGPWSDSNIAELKLRISPPWWLSWWACLAYLVIFVCLIIYATRSYTRKKLLENSLVLEKKKMLDEQNLNQERLRFYTNITHELRTPLTLILGPLEDLVSDSKLTDFYRNKIKTVHDSAQRLLGLINQILEFRKTETQNRALRVVHRSITEQVMEIGLRFKELNTNPKVEYKIINHLTDNPILYYDPEVVATILNNLLSNAIKYTPSGEIRLEISEDSVQGVHYVKLQVSDTGIGIDNGQIDRIFDRYYQVEGNHQASGTGIGLALVKSLIELHHGLLQVESQLGSGSVFAVLLPMDYDYPDALRLDSGETQESTGVVAVEPVADDTRMKILVVEDNVDIRSYLIETLQKDYDVEGAADGQEGWEKAQEMIPNLIISDVMMPRLNGNELCRLVKEDLRTCHIPLILLTAKDAVHDKEEGYAVGADSYLTKPFSTNLLRIRIANLLESRKNLARAFSNMSLPHKDNREEENERPREPQLNQLDRQFLDKFKQVVEENLLEPNLDVDFIASQFNMSYSTLYRKMKGLIELSPNELVRRIRLEHSVELLRKGNVNISEAAYSAGFNDVAYYRKCFKEVYGTTPTSYIQNLA
ncbi:MAG: response regulator [Bacteroidales bacterium]|nr:response regulator [Bacteroidales bacterium]